MPRHRFRNQDIEGIPGPKTGSAILKSYVIEPTQGSWSQNNNWGARFDGPYPTLPGEVGVLQNTTLPGPPRARSISLTRRDRLLYTPVFPTSLTIQIRCKVTVGTGGNVSTFLVNWGECVLNVVASTVQIAAVFAPTVEGAAYNNMAAVTGDVVLGGALGCSIGSDPAPYSGQNTLTYKYSSMAASEQVQVPPYAVAFSLIETSGAVFGGGAIELDGMPKTPSVAVRDPLGTYTYASLGANGLLSPTPLSSRAKYLFFSGAIPSTFSIVWFLGI